MTGPGRVMFLLNGILPPMALEILILEERTLLKCIQFYMLYGVYIMKLQYLKE